MNNSRTGTIGCDTLALTGLILLAACLRVGVVWLRSDEPMPDLDQYFGIARKLVAGEGYADPDSGRPTAYRPPVYPLLLASVAICGGGERTIAGLHALLGTLTVVLTYSIGKRLGLSRSAVVAAALVAVDPLLVHYTTILMNETVFTFLVTVLLWVGLPRPGDSLVQPCDSSSAVPAAPDREGSAITPQTSAARANQIGRDVATGIVAGLCALCRPTIWFFFGMLAVWWSWTRLRASARSGSRTPDVASSPAAVGHVSNVPRLSESQARWKRAPRSRIPWPTLVALAVTVSPWLVRNLLVLGHPILTTTHGGYTLLLGNNPVFYREVVAAPWGTVWGGYSLLNWWHSTQEKMQHDQPSMSDEVKRDRWLYRQALQHIRDEPKRFVQACFLRLVHLWNVTPLGPAAAGIPAPILWAVAGFYTLIGLSLCSALFRLTRNEWYAWAPLVILLISFSTVHLFYWSNARMRAPLVPAICLLAARGLVGQRTATEAERTGRHGRAGGGPPQF